MMATVPGPTPKLNASDSSELSVATAIDVAPAMKELAAAFESKFHSHVRLTVADSHALYLQIRAGAPFDAYFASDMNEPRNLAAMGKTSGSIRAYARNGLVMCISPMMPIQLPLGNPLMVLRNKAIGHVAIVDPHQPGIGKATVAALRRNRIYDETLRRKFVVGESASQTAQYVLNGSADVALLPSSEAVAGTRKIPIPSSSYRAIAMGAVVLRQSKHQLEARELVDFAVSSAAKPTFKRYGLAESPR
jgi:molybdate transport system substrate-binding protein